MSELLGAALLEIRTDDGTFYTDVSRAEDASEKLGTAMDKTSASADRLGDEMTEAAGKSKQLETALVQQEKRGQRHVVSLGEQRQGMRELARQGGDVITMYNLGARPSQIFATQIDQINQAITMALGSGNGFAAFLRGPWGIALQLGIVAIAPFVAKLFEAEKAFQAAELASDAFGDAQSILGRVVDLTTGKIKDQTAATRALAIAQAEQGLIRAEVGRANAEKALKKQASDTEFVTAFGVPLVTGFGPNGIRPLTKGAPGSDIAQQVLDGDLSRSDALARLRNQRANGKLSIEQYDAIATAVSNFGTEELNIERFEDLQKALNGDQEALGGFLRPGRTRKPKTNRGPSQSEIEADFEGELATITQRILSARIQIAGTAEERAELEARQVEWARRQSLDDIEANKNFSAVQKAELAAATTRLADAELEVIAFNKRAALEGDLLAMTDEKYRAQVEAGQIALSLADTEAERKEIALQLLDAEETYLRERLRQIADSQTAGEAERQRAQVALDALIATSADRRAGVERANETTLDRYLRELNQTPEQINEAIDAISIDGLDNLNDGLADAIRGARSLGDVFSSVADQIIADLLRIAIQQAIIQPIAGALFGGTGGGASGGGGLFGGLFAGFFAEGGKIPSGQFGVVGENGPELAFAGSGDLNIMSNPDSRRALGGTQITINNPIDATGSDPAALERVRAEQQRMREELPGQILSTVQDGINRRMVDLGGTS